MVTTGCGRLIEQGAGRKAQGIGPGAKSKAHRIKRMGHGSEGKVAEGAGRKAQGIGPGAKGLFDVFSVNTYSGAIRNQ